MKNMNIVLIGMRGSWKTSVGKFLTQRLGYGLRETDGMVEERVGQSIADFVREHGWDVFRKKETEAIADVAQEDHVVISTGGGVVLRRENIEALKANGYVIFLYAPIEVLVGRMKRGSDKRPLLTDAATFDEDVRRTWKEREALYRSAADVIINTAQQSPQLISEEIFKILKERRIL